MMLIVSFIRNTNRKTNKQSLGYYSAVDKGEYMVQLIFNPRQVQF